jgi:hypothetical protein
VLLLRGVDCRPKAAICQLAFAVQAIFAEAKLNLPLRTHRYVATGSLGGLIEFAPGFRSLRKEELDHGSVLHAFQASCSPAAYGNVLEQFVRSFAACAVFLYLASLDFPTRDRCTLDANGHVAMVWMHDERIAANRPVSSAKLPYLDSLVGYLGAAEAESALPLFRSLFLRAFLAIRLRSSEVLSVAELADGGESHDRYSRTNKEMFRKRLYLELDDLEAARLLRARLQ